MARSCFLFIPDGRFATRRVGRPGTDLRQDRATLTRRCLLGAAGAAWAPAPALRGEAQTVFLHAWAGDGAVNAFIAWLNERMIMRHGIRVRHVRLPDAASALLLAQGGAADGPLDVVMTHETPKRVEPGSRVVPFRLRAAYGAMVVPVQAPHKTGALLLERFLLSSEAQARAVDPLLMASPPERPREL